eukprot:150181-Hanusia_phi.AAC.1
MKRRKERRETIGGPSRRGQIERVEVEQGSEDGTRDCGGTYRRFEKVKLGDTRTEGYLEV